MATHDDTSRRTGFAADTDDLRADIRTGFADLGSEIADLRTDIVGAISRATRLMIVLNATLAALVLVAARLLW